MLLKGLIFRKRVSSVYALFFKAFRVEQPKFPKNSPKVWLLLCFLRRNLPRDSEGTHSDSRIREEEHACIGKNICERS